MTTRSTLGPMRWSSSAAVLPSSGTPSTASGDRCRRSSNTPITLMSPCDIASAISCSARSLAPTSTMFGVSHEWARQWRTSSHHTVCSTTMPQVATSTHHHAARSASSPPSSSGANRATIEPMIAVTAMTWTSCAGEAALAAERVGARAAEHAGDGGRGDGGGQDLRQRRLDEADRGSLHHRGQRHHDQEHDVDHSEEVRREPPGLADANGTEMGRAHRPTRRAVHGVRGCHRIRRTVSAEWMRVARGGHPFTLGRGGPRARPGS